jgi:hypothetical protein
MSAVVAVYGLVFVALTVRAFDLAAFACMVGAETVV